MFCSYLCSCDREEGIYCKVHTLSPPCAISLQFWVFKRRNLCVERILFYQVLFFRGGGSSESA